MSIRAINWAREVCHRIDVPPGERFILWAICLHHHDRTGQCFPSYDTIAAATGFKRRRVIYGVSALEANGLLIVQKRRASGHQASNHFVLFGRPAGPRWTATRVHSPAPCESAPQCTQPRVHHSAPDRDWYLKGEGPSQVVRLVAGGHHG